MDRILEDAGAEEHSESVKKWYDGYHFGNFDVYCPWDVMNYILELQHNPKAKPASYWKNTSDNAMAKRLRAGRFVEMQESGLRVFIANLIANATKNENSSQYKYW